MDICSVCGYIANDTKGKLRKCKSCNICVHERDCHVGSGDMSDGLKIWQCSVCYAKDHNKKVTGCCFCPYDGNNVYKIRLNEMNDHNEWAHVCCMFLSPDQAADPLIEHECCYCDDEDKNMNMLQVYIFIYIQAYTILNL